jgi:hypothetical protein
MSRTFVSAAVGAALMCLSVGIGCVGLPRLHSTTDVIQIRGCRAIGSPSRAREALTIPVRIVLFNSSSEPIAVREEITLSWSWIDPLHPGVYLHVGSQIVGAGSAYRVGSEVVGAGSAYRVLHPVENAYVPAETNTFIFDESMLVIETELALGRIRDLAAWKTGSFELEIHGVTFCSKFGSFHAKACLAGVDLLDVAGD